MVDELLWQDVALLVYEDNASWLVGPDSEIAQSTFGGVPSTVDAASRESVPPAEKPVTQTGADAGTICRRSCAKARTSSADPMRPLW